MAHVVEALSYCGRARNISMGGLRTELAATNNIAVLRTLTSHCPALREVTAPLDASDRWLA